MASLTVFGVQGMNVILGNTSWGGRSCRFLTDSAKFPTEKIIDPQKFTFARRFPPQMVDF